MLSFHNVAVAEFICSTEISYKWVRSPNGSAAQTPGAASGEATPGPADSGSGEASSARYAAIERSGPDEATAKGLLETEANRLKVRASEACRREHESFGTCVAAKLAAKASVLNALDFSARKQLQQALTEECKAQLGGCLGVSSSPPQCREIVAAQPTAAAGADKKGDSKKK